MWLPLLTTQEVKMFKRPQIEALFAELKSEWQGTREFEKIHRDVDLGIAYYDAGRPLTGVGLDERALALIEKHKPE